MHSAYRWKGTLIIVGPAGPRVLKFRFTWKAFAILALSLVISFCTLVCIGYAYPRPVTDREQMRVAQENRELRAGNLNAGIGASKMEEQIALLEKQSERIVELVETK